jgi:Uncharacterised nucleotidyltransferase
MRANLRQTKIMKNNAKSESLYIRLTYQGGSMRSLFRHGDRLLIQKSLMSDIVVGDVIVFQSQLRDQYIVHRVMSILATGFETRGDDRIATDKELVTQNQFAGRVEAVWRGNSWRRVRGGFPGLVRARLWQSIRVVHHSLLNRTTPRFNRSSAASNPDVQFLPERLFTLLKACCSETLRDETSKIPANIWPGLIALAVRQDVAPYLYSNLQKQNALAEIPEEIKAQLAKLHQNSWIMQQRLVHAHNTIVNALKHEEIDCISLKGLWYAHTLYRDPAARPMIDIDFLVRAENIPAALEIFKELGYVHIQEHDSVALEKEIWLYHPERRIKVDLHKDLIPYYSDIHWDIKDRWSRAIRTEMNGQPIMVLCPEDQIMHIILHGAFEHLFQPLKILLDAFLSINTWGGEVNWDDLRQQAEESGIGRALDLLAVMLRESFGESCSTLPTPVRHVPGDGIRWLLHTAPILHPPSLLHLYAGRDYLFYVLKRIRSVMHLSRGGQATSQSEQQTESKINMSLPALLRRAFTFSGLTVGFLFTSMRYPERKQFVFLRLLYWLGQR